MHSGFATLDHLEQRRPNLWLCLTLTLARIFSVLTVCFILGSIIGDPSSLHAQEKNTFQKNGSSWFNPLSWTNSDEPTSKQSASKKTNNQQSFAPQPVSGFPASNPFNWKNEPKPSQQGSAGTQTPVGNWIDQKFPVAAGKETVPNPLSWANETKPTTNAASLQPPKQASLSEAIQQSLSWQQDPNAATDPAIQRSKPPTDATDEQLVEWEKQTYPWIRPFYWSEPKFGTPEALAIIPEPELAPTPPAETIAPLLAKPFYWTNQPIATAVKPDKLGDARAVAFLQNGEQLPLPPQLASPQETLPPGSESSDESLRVSEEGEDDKGALGQAETLGREPVDNSLQFLRTATVLLKPGETQWDYGFAYSLFDKTLPVVVQTQQGSVIELARFRRRELIVPLQLRYGLARRIQLFAAAPFGWSNTEFALNGLDEFENTGGLGDLVFGGTFLLRQGNHEISDAIMTVAATAPTGQDPFAPVVGLTPSAPALGGGTWSLASNVLFVRNYDPVVFFYGAGTRQHFLRKVNGLNFRAGGEYNYQMGVGFAVNEKVTFSTRFNGAYISEARIDGKRVQGSIQEPMTVGLALTVSKCNRLIEPFVDFGLTNDATNARFGITWTR